MDDGEGQSINSDFGLIGKWCGREIEVVALNTNRTDNEGPITQGEGSIETSVCLVCHEKTPSLQSLDQTQCPLAR